LSRQLEDAAANNDIADVPSLLDELETAMAEALAAAQSLDGAREVDLSVPALLRAATFDYSAVRPQLAELRELLQRRSLRARKVFDSLRLALGDSPETQRLESVRQALATLDFATALSELDDITAAPEPVRESL
jgi:hypothetical protein